MQVNLNLKLFIKGIKALDPLEKTAAEQEAKKIKRHDELKKHYYMVVNIYDGAKPDWDKLDVELLERLLYYVDTEDSFIDHLDDVLDGSMRLLQVISKTKPLPRGEGYVFI